MKLLLKCLLHTTDRAAPNNFTIPLNKIPWTLLPCFEQWIGVAWDIIIFSILTSSMFEFILPWRFPRIFWVWLSYSTKMQKSMFFKGLTSLPQIMRKLKFIYSVKATKFCEISTLLLSYVVPVKSKVEMSQNFVAFSEYMNCSVCVGNVLFDCE